MGDVITHVISAIQPMLPNAVTAAVKASTEKNLTYWDKKQLAIKYELSESIGRVKQEVQLQRFDLDKLEQHSR